MSAPDPNELVMYLVVRHELNLEPGKLAAQAGHAVHLTLRKAEVQPVWATAVGAWEAASYPKVCLRASDKDFDRLCEKLKAAGVNHAVVIDEGRTDVAPATCLGLGPLTRAAAVPYVKRLQLYR